MLTERRRRPAHPPNQPVFHVRREPDLLLVNQATSPVADQPLAKRRRAIQRVQGFPCAGLANPCAAFVPQARRDVIDPRLLRGGKRQDVEQVPLLRVDLRHRIGQRRIGREGILNRVRRDALRHKPLRGHDLHAAVPAGCQPDDPVHHFRRRERRLDAIRHQSRRVRRKRKRGRPGVIPDRRRLVPPQPNLAVAGTQHRRPPVRRVRPCRKLRGVPCRAVVQIANAKLTGRIIQRHEIPIIHATDARATGELGGQRIRGQGEHVAHVTRGNKQLVTGVAVTADGGRKQIHGQRAAIRDRAPTPDFPQRVIDDRKAATIQREHGAPAIRRGGRKRLHSRRRIQRGLRAGPGTFHHLHIPIDQLLIIRDGRLRGIGGTNEQGILTHAPVSLKMLYCP